VNCDRIKDMMIEYLYGELTEDQADAFQAHLKECPACADEVAQLGRFRELASDVPDPEPSGLTIQRIVATAREEAEAPKPFWSFRWFKVLATVCVMAIVGGVVTYQVKTGIVTTAKVVSPPAEEAPAIPPSTEMVASGPKATPPAEAVKEEAPPVSAKPAHEPEPGSVLNGSTGPEDHVVAKAETRPSAPRETADEEKLYVIDRRSGEPIPVEPETSEPLTRSAADNYVTGSTREPQTEAKVEAPADKPLARKSMDSTRGLPSKNGGGGTLAKRLEEAQTALDSGQYDQTIHILSHVLKALPAGHPDRPRALMWLAKAYEGQGRKGEAAAVWSELAGESPEHAEMARRRIEALTRQ
jgi:TolA-binding protein